MTPLARLIPLTRPASRYIWPRLWSCSAWPSTWRSLRRSLSSHEAATETEAAGVSGPRLSMVRHSPPADFLAPDSALALAKQPEWVELLKEQNVVSAQPGKESFAIIKVSGAQHKVVEGDKLVVTQVIGLEVGENLVVRGDDNNVMMVGCCERTAIGRPGVPGAVVTLFCEEKTRDAKQIIFKKKRRKGYRRKKGYRRDISVLRVMNISYDYGEDGPLEE